VRASQGKEVKIHRQRTHLGILFLLLLVGTPAAAETLSGRVVGITDGDTLTLLTVDRVQVKVRLAEIDAPEAHQPYGQRAKQALATLAFGREVGVSVVDRDRYGRQVGRVHVGGVDVNAELVRLGAAWVYRRYSRDPDLLVLEEEARSERRGLWGLPETDRQPPWEWRASRRGGEGRAR
jgi:endonuclease YncB( thermonuclease family)